MESIETANTLLLFGSVLVLLGILSSLVAQRFGAPLLLIFLVIGMFAGEDGPGGISFSDYQLTYIIGSLSLAVILFAGVMARRVIGQRLLRWFEALIQRIPLASIVYSSARQLLDILQTKPDGTQRVVLVDFPHKEMKSIGFVTRVIREHGTGRELAAVYVPTTPNPTSGYLEIVPVEKITPTDWSVDQAMSFIISGGAVSPDTIPFSPPAHEGAPTSTQ